MPSVASLDVVSAAVIPGPFVSDPVHARFGQKLPHEFELAIGEEPLRVEQLCQVTNTLIDRQT